MPVFRWIHLSDVHYNFENYDTARMRLALKEYLLGLGTEFHLLFITGDFRYKDAAYGNDLADYIQELSAALNIPAARTFIVPGNHDVARGQMRDFLLKGIMSASNNDIDNQTGKLLLEGLDDFSGFHETLTGEPYFKPAVAFKDTRIHFIQTTDLAHVVHLNTCLFSGMDGEEGKLLLAAKTSLLKDLAALKKSRLPVIAIGHHGADCFTPEENRDLRGLFTDFNVDLYLCGHVHASGCVQDGSFVQITAGSGMADGSSKTHETDVGFTTGEFDADTGRVKAVFHRWSTAKLNKWYKDSEADRKAPGGVWEFSLPRFSGSSGGRPAIPAAAPVKPPEPAPDLSRYLKWLFDKCSWIDIRGLQVASGRAHKFPIEELYVPLYTTGGAQEENELGPGSRPHKTTLDELMRQPQTVIIGKPGSGKSTFIRRVAAILGKALSGETKDAAQQELGLSRPLFPIYITLGELADHLQRCRELKCADAPIHDDACEWLMHYLAKKSSDQEWGLTPEFFRNRCRKGDAILLLDGLDEAPNRIIRERIAAIVHTIVGTYGACTYIVTSRAAGYEGKTVLDDFVKAEIADLEPEGVELFLRKWSLALHHGNDRAAEEHFKELRDEVTSTPEIRRMATNPVMLTALAVLHYNDRHLPDQRADLYESIITWLLRAREKKPFDDNLSKMLHQRLAYTMQTWPGGRRKSLDFGEAVTAIAPLMPGENERAMRAAATLFLENEELYSGIVSKRGDGVEFWHLTFQEFLAAHELGGGVSENEFKETLSGRGTGVALLPEWRETLLLLAGVLRKQGKARANAYFSFIIEDLEKRLAATGEQGRLALRARYFSLMGAMVQDLSSYKYEPDDKRYQELALAVTAIFDKEKAASIEPLIRAEAGDALGQAGDSRVHDDVRDCKESRRAREKMTVAIPGGEFWMGAQKHDTKGMNFDEMADDDEKPFHKVKLSPFWIARYPVTVGQYRLFVKEGGYRDEAHWKAGGFGKFSEPGSWDKQIEYPTRPVVEVSWYEAAAFCAWAGVSLPTEAQWERAARGQYAEYRRYPWKGDGIDKNSANWGKSGVDRSSPVGVFPAGVTEEGVHDMSGNVWEWCADWFGKYDAGDQVDPVGPQKGESRVLRGGSWNYSYRGNLRCSVRGWNNPDIRDDNYGFRFCFFGI